MLDEQGEPWWVAKDVCERLGYKNTRTAIARHVDEEDRADVLIQDVRSSDQQRRNHTAINTSGVYALILGSKLPRAKKFKRWVTSEVLPTIRKKGAYVSPGITGWRG